MTPFSLLSVSLLSCLWEVSSFQFLARKDSTPKTGQTTPTPDHLKTAGNPLSFTPENRKFRDDGGPAWGASERSSSAGSSSASSDGSWEIPSHYCDKNGKRQLMDDAECEMVLAQIGNCRNDRTKMTEESAEPWSFQLAFSFLFTCFTGRQPRKTVVVKLQEAETVYRRTLSPEEMIKILKKEHCPEAGFRSCDHDDFDSCDHDDHDQAPRPVSRRPPKTGTAHSKESVSTKRADYRSSPTCPTKQSRKEAAAIPESIRKGQDPLIDEIITPATSGLADATRKLADNGYQVTDNIVNIDSPGEDNVADDTSDMEMEAPSFSPKATEDEMDLDTYGPDVSEHPLGIGRKESDKRLGIDQKHESASADSPKQEDMSEDSTMTLQASSENALADAADFHSRSRRDMRRIRTSSHRSGHRSSCREMCCCGAEVGKENSSSLRVKTKVALKDSTSVGEADTYDSLMFALDEGFRYLTISGRNTIKEYERKRPRSDDACSTDSDDDRLTDDPSRSRENISATGLSRRGSGQSSLYSRASLGLDSGSFRSSSFASTIENTSEAMSFGMTQTESVLQKHENVYGSLFNDIANCDTCIGYKRMDEGGEPIIETGNLTVTPTIVGIAEPDISKTIAEISKVPVASLTQSSSVGVHGSGAVRPAEACDATDRAHHEPAYHSSLHASTIGSPITPQTATPHSAATSSSAAGKKTGNNELEFNAYSGYVGTIGAPIAPNGFDGARRAPLNIVMDATSPRKGSSSPKKGSSSPENESYTPKRGFTNKDGSPRKGRVSPKKSAKSNARVKNENSGYPVDSKEQDGNVGINEFPGAICDPMDLAMVSSCFNSSRNIQGGKKKKRRERLNPCPQYTETTFRIVDVSIPGQYPIDLKPIEIEKILNDRSVIAIDVIFNAKECCSLGEYLTTDSDIMKLSTVSLLLTLGDRRTPTKLTTTEDRLKERYQKTEARYKKAGSALPPWLQRRVKQELSKRTRWEDSVSIVKYIRIEHGVEETKFLGVDEEARELLVMSHEVTVPYWAWKASQDTIVSPDPDTVFEKKWTEDEKSVAPYGLKLKRDKVQTWIREETSRAIDPAMHVAFMRAISDQHVQDAKSALAENDDPKVALTKAMRSISKIPPPIKKVYPWNQHPRLRMLESTTTNHAQVVGWNQPQLIMPLTEASWKPGREGCCYPQARSIATAMVVDQEAQLAIQERCAKCSKRTLDHDSSWHLVFRFLRDVLEHPDWFFQKFHCEHLDNENPLEVYRELSVAHYGQDNPSLALIEPQLYGGSNIVAWGAWLKKCYGQKELCCHTREQCNEAFEMFQRDVWQRYQDIKNPRLFSLGRHDVRRNSW